jgi:hypothetical protein
MAESFSEHLRQFSLAVGVVDESLLNDVFQLIREYVQDAFRMTVCVFFGRQMVNREPGLVSVWNSAGYPWSYSLRDAKGSYNGQVSFAYSLGKPLWIVSQDDQPLGSTKRGYLDLFRNANLDEIPPYSAVSDDPIRTSVYLPIIVTEFDESSRLVSKTQDIMGILNFESRERIECTSLIKKEMESISVAVSRFYKMTESYSVQSRGTALAKEELKKVLRNRINELKRKPLIGKNGLFLASSSSASDDVIGIIRTVLNEYSDSVEVYYWRQDQRTGNIHAQLWEKMRQSSSGIFYLSQRAEENSAHLYEDNPNVLFEAGMMYGLCGEESTKSAVIIVREADSPDVPFDIFAERRLTVPRDAHDVLNQELFRSNIKVQLEDLLRK